MGTVKLLMENAYEDGHESKRTVDVPAPVGDIDDWWDRVVLDETGDGHGVGNDLGYCYTATILEADDPVLVGEAYEWSGK